MIHRSIASLPHRHRNSPAGSAHPRLQDAYFSRDATILLRKKLASWLRSRVLHIMAKLGGQCGLTKPRRELVGDIPVMEQPKERVERLEMLRGLVERLCGPDLTLAEAKALRIQVLILLERRDLSTESDSSASSLNMT